MCFAEFYLDSHISSCQEVSPPAVINTFWCIMAEKSNVMTLIRC